MDRALAFFEQFEAEDLDWLLDHGEQQEFLAAQTVCNAGDLIASVHVVLAGLVGIYQVHADGTRDLLTQLGAGEIIGEMGWLTSEPAGSTVVALEPAVFLSWSRKQLNQKVKADHAFAVNLYRTIAMTCAQRVREANRTRTVHAISTSNASDLTDIRIPELVQRLQAFKEALSLTDKIALQNHGVVPQELSEKIQKGFGEFCVYINTLLGDHSTLEPQIKESIGIALQREFLPYLALADTADRFYSKPRGYAGDYFTIAKIYENTPSGTGRLGGLIDACFLARPPSAAVRNRRHLLRHLICEVMSENTKITTRITSLACGPAQELFDTFETLSDHNQLKASLIDIDLQALAFVTDKSARLKLNKNIDVYNSNLIYLATGRQKLDLPPQDFIYSIGLIDYFGDKFVIELMNFVYDLLKPGGKVVLGNFHPSNPDKAFMDHVLEWKLIHRSEDDMHRLFAQSKFGKPADVIHFEEQRINLFAQCSKSL